MNWQDALDYQADLFRFWGSENGRNVSEGFGESMLSKNSDAQSILLDRDGHFDAERIAYIGRWSSFTAEPIAVNDDVMDVLEAANKTFRPERLIPEDLLVSSGFAVFPRPFYVVDGKGKRVGNRAMSWAPCQTPNEQKSGVILMFYSHLDDEDDYTQEQGKLPFIGTKLALSHITPWWFYDELPKMVTSEDLSDEYADQPSTILDEAFVAPFRFFQVFHRIASQRLVQATQMVPQRAFRKRAMRAGITEDPYITVITLRRPKSPSDNGEPKEVAWTHRWIVGGHWHTYWYPTLQQHRQVWVGDYVKGPQDKELKVRSKRAFNFIR